METRPLLLSAAPLLSFPPAERGLRGALLGLGALLEALRVAGAVLRPGADGRDGEGGM